MNAHRKNPTPPPMSTNMLSRKIKEAMESRNLSIRDVAQSLDISYEHVRRVVNGEKRGGIPSQFTLKALCELLKLNFSDMKHIAARDKVLRDYGAVIAEMTGRNPELEPLESVWDKLTADQKRGIITMAQGWAKQNKSETR